MKKIYVLLCAASLVLSSKASEEKVLSLSLYDLTTESLSKVYTDTQGNTIKFTVNEPAFGGDPTFTYTANVDNPLACIGEIPSSPSVGAKYSMATMTGHATAKPLESPFILIEVPGNNNVLEIEILGYATSGGSHQGVEAELICCFSPDFDPTNDDSFVIDLEQEPLLAFKQTSCPTENKRALPKGTKFIKLIANDAFGWSGVMSYESKPQIHAINIYANAKGTSVADEEQELLNIQLFGRNLQLSETANVTIYGITGKLIGKHSNINNAYLDSLESGVYIIEATTQNGFKSIQKVIIK